MHVRPAKPADLGAITTLLAEARLPTDGVGEHLATFLVAERDGVAVAAAGLEIYGEVALVRSVVVQASHRARGLGQHICRALLDRARAAGVTHCYLLTDTAAAFFAALGFVEAPRTDAPPAIRATREFAQLCPASSTFMALHLD